MIGQKVFHPALGEGTVLDQRSSGMYLFVKFERGPKLWVNASALNILIPELKKPVAKPKIVPLNEEALNARKMIEAFRMGVVPYFKIEKFTFGREEELQKIFNNFENKKGGVIIIEGVYGSGKTHLLDYIYSWGLKNGFGVSRTELDYFDVAPYKPKHVYRELIKNFRFLEKGKEKDFRFFLKKISKFELQEFHPFLSPAFEILRKNKENNVFWDWIEGEELRRENLDFLKLWKLPVLLDHTPASDIYCNLLTSYSYFLKKLGYRGLILILDEVETLFPIWFLGKKELGFHFYKGLISVAKNDRRCLELDLKELRSFEFVGVGKLDKYNFVHSGVRPLPYLYSEPSYLFLVLSLTP
ncbi:ATP-binding protein, partial [Candidatus Aminicenantes bacterium AC-334-E05]|nr:ATP-binding protein [Candidatus Aminicenantes bacterium AC-334-E05]